MSGLVKAKKYDWKDTNLALFGSDTEKQVKKESAESEPAWQGCGQEVGLQIWRIVKFEVTEWPKEDYGKFYSGDSYIILNTYKDEDSDALLYDVHFWIGSNSTQDEYGTVAYKTVELDTFLDDKAVQHREVQGHESEMFKDYFESITIMKGGAESGFRHVEPEQYETRLLHFSGKGRHIEVKEVPACVSRLNNDDVFILDKGNKLFQWNGPGCNKDEKFKAMQYMMQLKSEHGGCDSETIDAIEDMPEIGEFYESLTADDEDDEDIPDEGGIKELYKVSDSSGFMEFEKVKEGDVSIDDFQPDDVFILDLGNECFVWIGSNASPDEKKNGITYAHKHLAKGSHSLVPISVVKEGQKSAAFSTAIAA